MFLLFFTLALLYPALCLAAPGPRSGIHSKHNLQKIMAHPTDNWFLDEDGRVRLFHGVNAVYKGFPWYWEGMLNDTKVQDLKSIGLNIVRLGTMWSGVEPVQGQYNETYMSITSQIITKLAEHGIYTLMDMHQDVFTSRYGISYDGVPRWLVDTYPEPTNPFPWPLTDIPFWEAAYATQTVCEYFQLFWDNYNQSIDQWVNFWGFLAERYKDENAVIGYNLMNEPWSGDFYSDPTVALPGVAGSRNLLPNYDKIHEKVHAVDPDGLIFYEPVMYGQGLHGGAIGSGFDRVPGGDDYRNVSAYSYHMYCWALEFIGPDATDEELTAAKEFCDNVLLPQFLNAQKQNVELTGGASMLTEFGICKTHQDQINVLCRTFMDLCDDYLMSWVEWDYADFTWYDSDGNRIMGKITPYARTYARAIAGVPTRMHFDDDTLDFELTFNQDTTIGSPTEIFVPRLRYENGFSVTVEGEDLLWDVEGEDVVLVYYIGVATEVKVPARVLISAL